MPTRFSTQQLPDRVDFWGLLRGDATLSDGRAGDLGGALQYYSERFPCRVKVNGQKRLRNMAHIMMLGQPGANAVKWTAARVP
jgi:hypothetical protein